MHAPPSAGGTQICFVQPSFGPAQIPQLELQQVLPAAQRVAPQVGPSPAGTQVP
jgi:hypothetical protein